MNKNRLIVSIALFCVVVLFFFFRFYNSNNRIAFGWDQEQYSFQIRKLVINHKPVLLGPRTTNDRGFFLAPYFTYLMVPFYLITNLHPNAILIFLFVYNLAFFISTYFIIKKLFHQYVALLLLAFWSINPLMAGYDFTGWWPIYIPLIIPIIWYLLKKIYENNHIIMWFILGLSIGIFMHMHVQFAFIILFVFTTLFVMRKHSKPDIMRIALLTIPILLSFTPLIIFDLRHEFLNLKAIQGFFTQQTNGIQPSITSWIPVFKNFIQPIIITKSTFAAVIFYFSLLVIQLFMLKNKKGFTRVFYSSSAILWIIFPIFFAKYGQRPSEYYFIFLYPFIYTIISDFFYTIKKIPLVCTLLIFLFLINFKSLQTNLETRYYSLKYKDELIRKLAEKTKGKIFNLSYTTELTTDYGFRYLIEQYQLKPTGNWKDPLVQIKIPVDNQSSIKVENMGVIIPKELAY